VRAEIHDFVSRRPDAGDQFLLHSKPTMIGGNSYSPHKIPLVIFPRRLGRRSPTGEQLPGGCYGLGRVMRQQRRDFQRHPAIHSVRSIVNRPEQIGSFCQVVERKVEKEIFARPALFQPSRIAAS
jgi:hypothetical protein